MPYEESVHSPRWFVWLVAGFALAAFVGGLLLLRDEDSRSNGGSFGGAVLIAVAALLTVVVRMFGTLRIRVDGEVLRVRFGPWGPTVRAEEIAGARVEPYRWLTYGGWGLRLGRQGGRASWAYSAPFVRTGVVVDTRAGKRYYLTSRRPAELAGALNELAVGGVSGAETS